MRKNLLFSMLVCACGAFTANAGSGIYIRGGVNSWNATSEWEFQETTTEGVYILEDKELSGAFKVADANWSLYNYGASTGKPELGTAYQLVSGSNTNIDLGDDVYECTKITLTIGSETNATLLIEGTNKEQGELTCVYVMGNNNSWNFNDESGKLLLTDEANVFEGDVTMVASEEGGTLGYWRIYEGLSQRGSWGTSDGQNTTESTLSGTLTRGSEGCITTAPGTYTFRFNISTGEFSLTSTVSSVDAIADNAVRVSAVNGEIRVSGAAEVAVYSIDGKLISRNATTAVSTGIYIVRADGKTQKVMVR